MNAKFVSAVSWYQKSMASKQAAKNLIVEQKYNIKLDPRTIYIGELQSENGLLWIMFLFTLGFSNILKFPEVVFRNGGATFLCFYFFMSIFIIVPIYLLEAGLAQFYSKTAVRVYEIVPIFRGLGWTAMIINIFVLIPSSLQMSWSCIYFFYAAFTDMPWNYCRNVPVGISCYILGRNTTFANKSLVFLSSSELFFEMEVQGARKRDSGVKYTAIDSLGTFNLKIFLGLVSVWSLISLISHFILNHYFKYVSYICFGTGTCLILLTIRCILLPGSFKGISMFISPDIDKTLTYNSLIDGLSYSMYSSSVTLATISVVGSQNIFNSNLLRDARYVTIGNFCVGLLSGLMHFSALGYLSESSSESVKNLIGPNEISLSTFIEAVSQLFDARLLSIMFMVMMMVFGVSSGGVGLASLVVCLIDNFPWLFKLSLSRKNFASLILCGSLCILSLFFTIEGTFAYKSVFTFQIEYITCPLMVMIEIIIVHYIYGTRRFRLEMKMIHGYSFSFIWIISSNVVTPLLMVVLLSFNAYSNKVQKVSLWATITSNIITVMSFTPLIADASLLVYKNVQIYQGFEILYHLIKCPDIYGPYYKIHWLLGKEYQLKLVRNRKNPQFLETVRQTESLDEVLTILKETMAKKKKAKQEKQETLQKEHRKIFF